MAVSSRYKVKLKYKSKTKKTKSTAPPVELPTTATAELGDARVREIHRTLGGKSSDYQVAKRVATLEKQMPNGTLPELVTYEWLEGRQVPYTYLAQLFGGHQRIGGVEIDFLIHKGGDALAWQVDGSYFHGRKFQLRFAQEGRDLANDMKLIGATFMGMKIAHVVHLVEEKIYLMRPLIFEMALNGVGLG